MLPPAIYAPSLAHFLFNMVKAFFGPAPKQTTIRWLRIIALVSLMAIVILFLAARELPIYNIVFYYVTLALVFWLSIGLIIYLQATRQE